MVRCGLCSFLIIKSQIVLQHAVRCTVIYDAIQLYHFADNFGPIFTIK